MAITESFKKASSMRDVRGIRIMMKDSLLVDPTFSEFKEMESLAKCVDGLYDSHDGREFSLDKSTWDDDYMNKLMVQVVGNFSHERIHHLKDVVGYLRPVTARTQASASSASYMRNQTSRIPTQEPQFSYHQQKQQNKRNHNRGVKIAMSAIAGGVAGGVAAVAIGTSVIAGAAIGAIATGVVIAVVTNGGQ